jgi:hypothetical protein
MAVSTYGRVQGRGRLTSGYSRYDVVTRVFNDMPIDANRAHLIRKALEGAERASGTVLTLGVKPLEDDLNLFADLGYGAVEAIDVSGFEGAQHIADLNLPIPDELKGRFALIYNGGTLEHIFDTRAVLRNLHEMLAPDGVIVHVGPMNGWAEHGFYQFSPTLFADYYHVNGYEARPAFLLGAQGDDYRRVCIETYLPGKFYTAPAGSFPGIWNFHMTFIKRPGSSWDKIPQQGYYVSIYGDPTNLPPACFPDTEPYILYRGMRED